MPCVRAGFRRVHHRRAHAAFRVGFEAFERVGVQQDRAAHAVRFPQQFDDLRGAIDPERFEQAAHLCQSGFRRVGSERAYGEGVQMQDGIRTEAFELEIDEIRFAVGMAHGAFEKRLQMRRDAGFRQDLFRAGDVPSAARGAHFEGEQVRRHRQGSSWRTRCGPARCCP